MDWKERTHFLSSAIDPEGLASDMYKSAHEIKDPKNEVEALLLAHLVREIIDRCLYKLDLPTQSGQSIEKLDELRDLIKRNYSSIERIPEDRSSSREALGEASRLFKEIKDAAEFSSKRGRDRYKKFLSRLGSKQGNRYFTYRKELAASRLQNIKSIAAKTCHTDRELEPKDRMSGAAYAFHGLSDIIDGLNEEFTPKASWIDRVAEGANEGKDPEEHILQRLSSIMADADAEWRFFHKLNAPGLITALKERGFFDYAPPPEDYEDGTRLTPNWGASKFLVRMASKAPEEVFAALMGMDIAGNVNVAGDFLEAAIEFPVRENEQAVRVVYKALDSCDSLTLATKIPDLVKKIASTGNEKEAIELVHEVLALEVAEEEVTGLRNERSKYGISDWGYKNILSVVETEYEGRKSLVAFKSLRSLLINSLFDLYPKNKDTLVDPSAIRCPNLEDEKKGYERPLSQVLRSFAKVARNAARIGEDERGVVMERLSRPAWSSMKRVHFLVCRDHLNKKDVVRETIDLVINERNFSDFGSRPEYRKLVRAAVDYLESDEIKRYADMVLSELSEGVISARMSKRLGRPPAEEEVRTTVAILRIESLGLVADKLPAGIKAEYERLVAEHGPPRDNDEVIESGVSRFSSGGDATIFLQASADEIIAKLEEEAKKPGGFRDLDPFDYDMGKALESAVKTRPEELGRTDFAARIPKNYSVWYVRGLTNSAKDGRTRNIRVALDCVNAIQPLDQNEWRMSVLQLIEEIVKQSDSGGASDAKYAWETISPYLKMEDPHPNDPRKAYDDAINWSSGKAADVAIQILLAIHNDKLPDAGKETTKAIKTKLVDLLIEGSNPLIHASLGIRLPQMWAMDEKWAKDSIPHVFHSNIVKSREAAWRSYVSFNPLYQGVGPALSALYEEALQHAHEPQDSYGSGYMDQLGRHLIIMWGMKIGTEDLVEKIPFASSAVVKTMLRHGPDIVDNVKEHLGASIESELWDLWNQVRLRVEGGDLTRNQVVEILEWVSASDLDREKRIGALRWLLSDERTIRGHFPHGLLDTLIEDVNQDHEVSSLGLKLAVFSLPVYEVMRLGEELFGALNQVQSCSNQCASELMKIADYMNRHGQEDFMELYEKFQKLS